MRYEDKSNPVERGHVFILQSVEFIEFIKYCIKTLNNLQTSMKVNIIINLEELNDNFKYAALSLVYIGSIKSN